MNNVTALDVAEFEIALTEGIITVAVKHNDGSKSKWTIEGRLVGKTFSAPPLGYEKV